MALTVEAEKQLGDFAKTIMLNSGKATFKNISYLKLDGIVAILKDFKAGKFTVKSHADSTDSDALNQKLSDERAAVKYYFVSKGIDAARLTAKGFGESMPIDSNKTSQGRANNSRVEVKIIK